MTILLASFLTFSLLPAGRFSDQSIIFRVEPLTLSETINSVDFFKDGFMAVGENGLVIVVYYDGYRIVERQASENFLHTSCNDRYCIAIGEDGLAIIYDSVRKKFKHVALPNEDYFKSVNYRRTFFIAYDRGIVVYAFDSGTIKTIKLDVEDLEVFKDKIAVLSEDSLKILDMNGRELQTLSLKNVKNPEKIGYANQTLWILGDHLYRWNGTGFQKVLEGRYNSIHQYDNSLLLSSENSIYKWSMDERGLELITTIPDLIGIRVGEGRVIVFGEGYLAEIYGGATRYYFIPSSAYASSSSDNERAVVVGKDNVLIYENGYFRRVKVPSDYYISASIEGDVVVVLGSKNILEIEDEHLRTLPYKSGDYTSIMLSSRRVFLTSSRGLFEIDLDTYSAKQIIEASLTKVSKYGAVGKEVLIVPSSSGYDKVKINFTAVDVSGAGCTMIIVGKKGLVAIYREGKIEYVKVSRDDLTAVSLNNKYGLIGDSKGNLYLFDGYVISPLPYNLGEEVKSISWTSSREALIITPTNIYRFIEEYYPEPSLKLQRPEYIRVYNGSETKITMLLKPLYGYSGKIELTPSIDLDGASVRIEPNEINVREMCPVEISLKIHSESWAKGNGRLEVFYDGFKDELNIAVEPKISKNSDTHSMPYDTVILYIIMPLIIFSLTAIVLKKKAKEMRKKQKAPPTLKDKEW